MGIFSFKLGEKVRDRISGFTGIVTVRAQFLNGCTRYTVTPQELHDGKPIEDHSFDEPQLDSLGEFLTRPAIVLDPDNWDTNTLPTTEFVNDGRGGPKPKTKQRSDVKRRKDIKR